MHSSILSIRSKWLVLMITLLAIAGASIIYYSTPYGPWAIEDTVGYFDTAQNFAAGRGLVQTRPSGRLEPSYLQPPFYPMVLAPAALFKLDMVQFSRFLEIVLYAGIIFLTGFYTLRVAHSPQLALLSTSVLLVNTAMLNNYTGAMSEGLYFFLGFLSIFLFIYHTQKPGSWIVLLSGIAAGLAFLTRFAGLAFIIVGVVGFLLFDNGRLTKRLINTLIYLVPAGLPYLFWNLYLWQFPNISASKFDWHVANMWEAASPVRGVMIDSFWNWFGLSFILRDPPYRIEMIILVVLSLSITALILFSLYRFARYNHENGLNLHPVIQLGSLWFVFSLATLAILLFSYLFRLPKPDLYDRILSPIQIGLLLSLLAWFEFIAQTWPERRIYQVIPLAFGLVMIVVNIPGALQTAQALHEEGRGYTSKVWLTSPVINAVRNLPVSTPVISNQPAAIFFLTGHPSYDMISSLINAGINAPGVRYGDNQKDSNQVIFRTGHGALVVFESGISAQLSDITGESGANTLIDLTRGLFNYAHFDDGQIYFYSP